MINIPLAIIIQAGLWSVASSYLFPSLHPLPRLRPFGRTFPAPFVHYVYLSAFGRVGFSRPSRPPPLSGASSGASVPPSSGCRHLRPQRGGLRCPPFRRVRPPFGRPRPPPRPSGRAVSGRWPLLFLSATALSRVPPREKNPNDGYLPTFFIGSRFESYPPGDSFHLDATGESMTMHPGDSVADAAGGCLPPSALPPSVFHGFICRRPGDGRRSVGSVAMILAGSRR